ncbi:hypothetical protein F7734_31290 [Scytonema sp. UIC 10036]|uniref:hypothetical protein n=1 Tax=Scytonema sp. UIC 10036 TaxID=2304196 RepID=UPI0012DADCDC|nr:hypothetical protein [Scytonema sp. UIC 10036]MUG96581.1 hypothetical protein [Scytonema sp. UIC 10036]
MGLLGSLLQITLQASVSDHYHEHRTVALTEMNVAASISAGLVPLLIGGFAQIGLGWRSALFLAAIALTAIAFLYRQVSISTLEGYCTEIAVSNQKLSMSFWIYWIVLFLGV